MNQNQIPLYNRLKEHQKNNSYSFHVPGHKNGRVFPSIDSNPFADVLPFDLTELPGLDDLHHAEGVIREAELLAADFFYAQRTYFLVNGTTAGNLAMILSVCSPGDEVLIQRNSHQSIMHALELAGAQPIFISPEYDEQVDRTHIISSKKVGKALDRFPNVKAVVLTYPDYFGSTYDLSKIIEHAHEKNIPVLVDEAHGAHFRLSEPFPKSAIDLGADVVVHSAHKTLPALTMGSFLHLCSDRISEKKMSRFLQMVQTSSPSYLVMASLDLARQFIATRTTADIRNSLEQIDELKMIFGGLEGISVQPIRENIDDPFKTTLVSDTINLHDLDENLRQQGIFPEMVQNNQLLLIHGFYDKQMDLDKIRLAVNSINDLQNSRFRGKIEGIHINKNIYRLDVSYHQFLQMETEWLEWSKAIGKIAAETVTPYPPGIPLILRGERIGEEEADVLSSHQQHFQSIQYDGFDLKKGIKVFKE